MRNKFIVMNLKDNCATALEGIPMNTEIKLKDKIIRINHKIPMGHKFALNDIKEGELIKKYGEIIGIAIKEIKAGDWVHIHNVKSHYLEVLKE